jgi:hypothetical protein
VPPSVAASAGATGAAAGAAAMAAAAFARGRAGLRRHDGISEVLTNPDDLHSLWR